MYQEGEEHGCVPFRVSSPRERCLQLVINNDVLLDTENEVNSAVNLQDLGEFLLPSSRSGWTKASLRSECF